MHKEKSVARQEGLLGLRAVMDGDTDSIALTSIAATTDAEQAPLDDADTGPAVPLQPAEKRKAVLGYAFVLANSTIGAGVLVLPFVMRECGVLLTLVLLVAAALLTDYSCVALARCFYAVRACVVECRFSQPAAAADQGGDQDLRGAGAALLRPLWGAVRGVWLVHHQLWGHGVVRGGGVLGWFVWGSDQAQPDYQRGPDCTAAAPLLSRAAVGARAPGAAVRGAHVRRHAAPVPAQEDGEAGLLRVLAVLTCAALLCRAICRGPAPLVWGWLWRSC